MNRNTYMITWYLYLEHEEIENSIDEFTQKNFVRLINFLNLYDDCITYFYNGSVMSFSCNNKKMASDLSKRIHELSNKKTKDSEISANNLYKTFEVKDILVNGPATIVFWEDGTKTVVKYDSEDLYDAEKAVAMCFMKKALGSRSMHKLFDLAEDRKTEYYNQFTQLSLKEIGYCLHDAISTILNQNQAKPCEGKIITDKDNIAEKMHEESNKDKEQSWPIFIH